MHDFLRNEAALASFLHLFESGQLPKARWTHAAHIAAGTLFLRRHGAAVLPHMRAAIQRHNASVGTPPSAYHETLTVLWLALLDEAIREQAFRDDFAAASFTVGQFGEQRTLHRAYYSFDVVQCPEARMGWVPPDLRALPVAFTI